MQLPVKAKIIMERFPADTRSALCWLPLLARVSGVSAQRRTMGIESSIHVGRLLIEDVYTFALL